jgi:hypothetical protein
MIARKYKAVDWRKEFHRAATSKDWQVLGRETLRFAQVESRLDLAMH